MGTDAGRDEATDTGRDGTGGATGAGGADGAPGAAGLAGATPLDGRGTGREGLGAPGFGSSMRPTTAEPVIL